MYFFTLTLTLKCFEGVRSETAAALLPRTISILMCSFGHYLQYLLSTIYSIQYLQYLLSKLVLTSSLEAPAATSAVVAMRALIMAGSISSPRPDIIFSMIWRQRSVRAAARWITTSPCWQSPGRRRWPRPRWVRRRPCCRSCRPPPSRPR